MKAEIHPTYYPDAKVICACGNSWSTGSTKAEIRVDICSNCHPFYTGEQRIVDTEGQVDRFYKRLEVRTEYKKSRDAAQAAKTSPERPLADFELTKKTLEAYKAAGIQTAGEFIDKLAGGDDALLALEGVGRKGLADTKKALKRAGFALPEGAEAEAEPEAEAAE